MKSLVRDLTAFMAPFIAFGGAIKYHGDVLRSFQFLPNPVRRTEAHDKYLLKTVLSTLCLIVILPFMNPTDTAVAAVPSFVPSWVKDAVFYQIFPERFANGDPGNDPKGTEDWGGKPTGRNYFGGDLRGIIGHLDYISRLGVNAMYLNPVFTSKTNHKYSTMDYMTVDPHFGDDATFSELVDSCHARGIRIILDAVFNHTGVDFFAFDDLRRHGKNSRYRNWYNVHNFPVGPANKPNYDCWWGHGSLPKLMTGNAEVREYLFSVTRHWMAKGIDGWRLDVPNEIPHEFWIEWRKLVKSINPDAYIVGEIWNDATLWLGGDQFDGVMNYRFRDACVDLFARHAVTVSRFDGLLARQRRDYPAEVSDALLNLLGSHDTERFLTMCGNDTASWKLAVLFQMTYTGAPMIYYGDEVGMVGGRDPACRGTMVWSGKNQNTDMLSFVKRMVSMRTSREPLRRGTYRTLLADDQRNILAFARETISSTIVVVMNTGFLPQEVTIPLPPSRTHWRVIFPEDTSIVGGSPDELSISLPERRAKILIGE
jgi:glycosidase